MTGTDSQNTTTATLVRGSLYGLTLATVWLLIEGLYLSSRLVDAPIWATPVNLGVGAPIVLAMAAAFALSSWGWSRLYGVADPLASLVSGMRTWLTEASAEVSSRRSAWLVAVPLLTGVWFAIALPSGVRILGTVKTTAFAVLLIAGVLLVAAVVLGLLASLLVAPLTLGFATLTTVIGRGFTPVHTLATLLVVSGLGFLGAWFALPDVLPHLPWHFAVGPAVGALAVAAVQRRVADEPRRVRLWTALLTALVVASGLGALFLPQSRSDARPLFVGQPSIASATYGAIHDRLDHDDDGAIAFYGQNDCAPHDPSIGPHQVEIAANGIDENCSGSDLTVDLEEFGTGKTSHPRPESIVRRPHIILVTTDGLSQHHTSVGGYHRDTTPNLADWASRATVFEHAFSLSSSTRLAMPGLVTGMFNSMVKMKNRRVHPYHYAKSVPTIASVLKREGYRTVHIPGDDYFLGRRWGGYTHGFDVVDPKAYREARDRIHTAPEVTDRGIAHIKRHQQADKPLFLWLHYYDHHEPNRVPRGETPFPVDSALNKYDNELHFADRHWGRLFETIEEAFEPHEYMVVFTADHGEVFDEKHPKGRRHDFTLDTKVLHVPLIIQGPKQRGARVEGLVSHPDILATIANVVGRRPHPRWVGESLVGVLFDGEPVEKDAVFSLFYTPEAVKRGRDGFSKIGVRTQDYYYWENRPKDTRLLIDWKADPGENDNLADEKPEILESYRWVAARKLQWLREEERGLKRFARKRKDKTSSPKKRKKRKERRRRKRARQ